MKQIAWGLLGASLGIACTSVGVTRVAEAPPKVAGCKLDVYTSEAEIRQPFQVVCLIDSRTGTTAFHTKTASAAIQNARPRACECGADALIVAAVDTEGATYATWGQGKAILKAIRYQSAPPAAPQAAAGRGVGGRPGNATVRISINKEPWVAVDADLEGKAVRALYSESGRRLPLFDCLLGDDLKATCIQTVDRATFSVEIDAGGQTPKP